MPGSRKLSLSGKGDANRLNKVNSNLLETASEEIKKIGGEIQDQVLGKSEATEPCPAPDLQNSSLESGEKAERETDAGKKISQEKQIEMARSRIRKLREESDQARGQIIQEQKEKREKRDPVVEGLKRGEDEEKNDQGEGEQRTALPPLPEMASRPRRGSFLARGSNKGAEKRQLK